MKNWSSRFQDPLCTDHPATYICDIMLWVCINRSVGTGAVRFPDVVLALALQEQFLLTAVRIRKIGYAHTIPINQKNC